MQQQQAAAAAAVQVNGAQQEATGGALVRTGNASARQPTIPTAPCAALLSSAPGAAALTRSDSLTVVPHLQVQPGKRLPHLAGSQAQNFSQKLASPAQGQSALQAPPGGQEQGKYWAHICGKGFRVGGSQEGRRWEGGAAWERMGCGWGRRVAASGTAAGVTRCLAPLHTVTWLAHERRPNPAQRSAGAVRTSLVGRLERSYTAAGLPFFTCALFCTSWGRARVGAGARR